MTEGSRQVFPALELGPGCLVLGIISGPSLSQKVPSQLLLQLCEELVVIPGSVGTYCASHLYHVE